jgi:putative ABC transport system substrate-binding protein
MISDLLRLGVDLLVTGGTAATVTAKQATSTVPIVGLYLGDPVGTGLAQSLARPGANVTGLANGSTDITGKQLELLQKIEPTLRRVGYLYNPANAAHVTVLAQMSAVATASGLEVVPAPVPAISDLDAAFERAVAGGAEAFIWSGFLQTPGDTRVAALALSHRLISLGSTGGDNYPAAGGLMSYGPDVVAIWRRAGYFVDRILKGAKPADLPVELPTTYDLIVNHTTAAALGVTIPDEVAQQVTTWI